jgi:hypothetical protein
MGRDEDLQRIERLQVFMFQTELTISLAAVAALLALDADEARIAAAAVAIVLTFCATQMMPDVTLPQDVDEHLRFTGGQIRRHAGLLIILSVIGEASGIAILATEDERVWIGSVVIGGIVGVGLAALTLGKEIFSSP